MSLERKSGTMDRGNMSGLNLTVNKSFLYNSMDFQMFPNVFQEFSKCFCLISIVSKFAKCFGKSPYTRTHMTRDRGRMETSFQKNVANLEISRIIDKHLEKMWKTLGKTWKIIPLCK